MAPRLPGLQGIRSLTVCLRSAATATLQPLVQRANLSRKEKKRMMKQDRVGWAQREQRKAINVKHQEKISAQRAQEWGHPVHGITTPFVESFDSGGQAPLSTPPRDEDGNPLEKPHELPTSLHVKNYLLCEDEINLALQQCYTLTKPLAPEEAGTIADQENPKIEMDPEVRKQQVEEHEARHAKAVEAIRRMAELTNGSAKDRRHANIRRIIETFGRHMTDKTLPRPAPPPSISADPNAKSPIRGGPDTGSSEVQIAILTAKIRALAKELEGPKGHRDKNNKRSLRVLVHKRQRLLRYMERRERGSERWHYMIKTLGLSPATWKEQITL